MFKSLHAFLKRPQYLKVQNRLVITDLIFNLFRGHGRWPALGSMDLFVWLVWSFWFILLRCLLSDENEQWGISHSLHVIRWRENVPGISGACTTRNFTYQARGPWRGIIFFVWFIYRPLYFWIRFVVRIITLMLLTMLKASLCNTGWSLVLKSKAGYLRNHSHCSWLQIVIVRHVKQSTEFPGLLIRDLLNANCHTETCNQDQ